MAGLIIPDSAPVAVNDLDTVLRSELAELRRYGLITPVVFSRCVRYLDRHLEEFSPAALGPISAGDAVDYLLQVAS